MSSSRLEPWTLPRGFVPLGEVTNSLYGHIFIFINQVKLYYTKNIWYLKLNNVNLTVLEAVWLEAGAKCNFEVQYEIGEQINCY